jgi:hypothetical protein
MVRAGLYLLLTTDSNLAATLGGLLDADGNYAAYTGKPAIPHAPTAAAQYVVLSNYVAQLLGINYTGGDPLADYKNQCLALFDMNGTFNTDSKAIGTAIYPNYSGTGVCPGKTDEASIIQTLW